MRTRPALAAALLAATAAFAPAAQAQSARVDSTFALTGLTVLPWTSSNLENEVVAIAANGEIFIAHEGPSDITVMRLAPDGTPLATYVGAGIARVTLKEPLRLSALYIEPDGALILGGGHDLMRVAATGYVDSTFGDAGRMRIPYITNGVCGGGNVRRILKSSDGAWIVVGGRSYLDASPTEQGCTYFARVSASGQPDLAFGTQGNTSRGGLIGFDARLLADGTIEVIGRYAGQAGSWIEHLRPNGSMQDAFGTRGSMRLGDNGPGFFGTDGRILSDGSLVFVTSFDQPTLALHRYRADLKFDPTFAGVGRTVVALRDGQMTGPRVLPVVDGGFIVRGNVPGSPLFSVFYKVDARGIPDISFGDNGYARHVAAAQSRVVAWDVQPDGHVLFTAASFASLPATLPVIPPTPLPHFAVNAHASRIQAVPDVVEFRNIFTNHYFVTYDGQEAVGIDGGVAGPGWQRTGERFRPGGLTPVCRFYNSGPNTHFFTIEPGECEDVKHAPGWSYEGLGFFGTRLASGKCAAPLVTVYRIFNNRQSFNDSNHRYVTDLTLVPGMVAQGWSLEGAVFCAKP